MNDFIDDARQLAAQCWCDPETSDRVMDPVLAESVARRIAVWMDSWAQAQRNADFYRGLLNDVANYLGPDVYRADDGTIMEDPLLLKIPELIARLIQENDAHA